MAYIGNSRTIFTEHFTIGEIFAKNGMSERNNNLLKLSNLTGKAVPTGH